MDGIRHARWARALAWLLTMVMAVPWVAGCATGPEAREPRLVAVVVDGQYAAREGEDAFVRVWRDGQPIPVRTGMRLHKGDRVSTGERADVVIRYPNGTELLMRAGSTGRIGSITEAIGEFFATVWGVFGIETEYVKAGARGTAFHLRAAPDGRAEVWVLNGRVELSSRQKAWRPLILSAGTGAVAQREAVSPPRRLTDAEIAETRAWVDRVEQLVPPEQPESSGSAVGAAVAIGAAAILLGAGGDKPSTADRTDRRPQAPPLAAPVRLRPGSPDAQQAPKVDCRSPVTLAWDRVARAEGYAVTLQALPPRTRSWRTLATPVTDAPRARTPAGIAGRLRWWVRARDARGDGPVSATVYFDCAAVAVR